MIDSYFREEGIIFQRIRLSMEDKELALEKYEGRIFQTEEQQVCSNAPRQAWHV